jgi:hypothetical protein
LSEKFNFCQKSNFSVLRQFWVIDNFRQNITRIARRAMNYRPLLVTGSPRSGTTWVSDILRRNPKTCSVHEPFNISRRLCSCGVGFDRWFYYVSKENESAFHDHVAHTIGPPLNRYIFTNMVSEAIATKRVRPLFTYLRAFSCNRVCIKDPLALFSAEWVSTTFAMDVIVLIRHPAAVVHSYKSLQWSHNFDHFLKQPLLMQDHLYPFEAEIVEFAKGGFDIVDQAALLWKLIYHMVMQYQQKHHTWLFVRHEDLANAPISAFQELFDTLGFPYSESIKCAVDEQTNAANPVNVKNPYTTKLHSIQTAKKWRSGLTPQEIKRIRSRVEEVSTAFYSDAEW